MPNSGDFPLNLAKPPRALRFGIDSLLLSAFAYRSLRERFLSAKKNHLFVELGCGDGTALLGLLVKRKDALALGLDINADFITLARENAKRLSLAARFLAMDARMVIKDPTLREWREKANLVLANPPWRLPSEGHRSTNRMRDLALWAETDSLAAFTKAASFFLRHGGQFCSVIHPATLPLLIREMEKNSLGLREILPITPRKDQKALRLLLRAQKNAQSLPVFLFPLVLHKENSSCWSEEALAFCPWLANPEIKNNTSPEKT